MKNVSFRESRSSFREVIRGIAILALVFSWIWSRTATAGTWEYAAPYTVSPGSNGITAVTGTGPGMQLFRENMTYQITPYYPPAQPRQNQSSNWLPFAMVGLAMAPMLFSDSPANHGVTAATSPQKGYQLAKDVPTGQTVRRGPAAIPLRTRYQQVQPQQIPAGTR